MNNNASWIIAILGLMGAVGSAADAASFELDFAVRNFEGVFGSSPTPTDPVSGSIIWEADGIRDPIQSFDSISLTLDGHAYTVGEIGYSRSDFPYSGIELIGGTITGPGGMYKFTDDFWIRWDRNLLAPFDLSYTSSQHYGFWSAYGSNPDSFTSFSITEVPEPACASLVLLGLVVLSMRPNRRPGPRTFHVDQESLAPSLLSSMNRTPNKRGQPTPVGRQLACSGAAAWSLCALHQRAKAQCPSV